ncbi:hypothetical protein [Moorena bouillonii]|uniref:hypothetical protein n=1 Tax=Moorena bouillonii TaxID=207920 RepID=UPI0018E98AEE|nr:hypothetical protein [Moorena bouillonii]
MGIGDQDVPPIARSLSSSGAFPLDGIYPKRLYPCLGLPGGNHASRSWGATASWP